MYNIKPSIITKPKIDEFKNMRLSKGKITVLSGPNNSGKTYVLKSLRRSFDALAFYIPCQRFLNQREFNTRTKREHYYQEKDVKARRRIQNEVQNEDSGDINLNDILFNLKDKNRGKLMELSTKLLGEKFSMEQSEKDNDWSSRYIQVGGYNLCFSSTGTRLLLTILGSLLDEAYEVVLIDEPELGLTPTIQDQLAKAFKDKEMREKYFPHIKHIFIATHSHIFLDHTISNNFVVTKTSDGLIEINQVKSINEFHKLQFNLLGNTLESMFLPSAIVIIEGVTDRQYIEAIVSKKFPKKIITFQTAYGEGRYKELVNVIDNFLGGLNKSPYRNVVFIVLDKRYSTQKTELIKKGVLEENIIQWNKNGIEYYYPKKIMTKIFSCEESDVDSAIDQMNTNNNGVIEINKISWNKNKLCNEVVRQLADNVKFPKEFQEKLLNKLKRTLC